MGVAFSRKLDSGICQYRGGARSLRIRGTKSDSVVYPVVVGALPCIGSGGLVHLESRRIFRLCREVWIIIVG